MERQLLETRSGLEGLVGKVMSQQALHRLKALYNQLTGSAGICKLDRHPASIQQTMCKAIVRCCRGVVVAVQLLQLLYRCCTGAVAATSVVRPQYTRP